MAPNASPEQLDEAVSAAQRAYSSWQRLSFAERSALIGEFSEAIESRADEIAQVLTREQGKPLSQATGEVMDAAHELKALCQFEPHPELIRADDDSRYAPESLYEPLIEALVQLARAHRVGDGFEPDVQMGPIQNKMQFDKVLGLIKDARQHRGARIFEGGQTLGGSGYFVAPIIVAAPEDDMRLVAEEQFGPVLPVLKYRNIDDAVHRANNSRYGLGASIWTKDAERGAQVATQIEAGTVWINHHTRYEAEIPFGGFKESGFGREHGRLGLLSYMEPQVIYHLLG